MGEKVVLDTNVLVSALGWPGKPRAVFRQVLDGKLTLIISAQQLQELRRVLTYPKLGFSEEEQLRFFDIVSGVAVLVEAPGKLKIVPDDPDDDIIVESAVIGGATYIVSSDVHLRKLAAYGNIRIFNPTEFLMR